MNCGDRPIPALTSLYRRCFRLPLERDYNRSQVHSNLGGETGVRGNQNLLLLFAQRLGHAEYVRRSPIGTESSK